MNFYGDMIIQYCIDNMIVLRNKDAKVYFGPYYILDKTDPKWMIMLGQKNNIN